MCILCILCNVFRRRSGNSIQGTSTASLRAWLLDLSVAVIKIYTITSERLLSFDT